MLYLIDQLNIRTVISKHFQLYTEQLYTSCFRQKPIKSVGIVLHSWIRTWRGLILFQSCLNSPRSFLGITPVRFLLVEPLAGKQTMAVSETLLRGHIPMSGDGSVWSCAQNFPFFFQEIQCPECPEPNGSWPRREGAHLIMQI